MDWNSNIDELLKQRLADRAGFIQNQPQTGSALEAANPQVTAYPNAAATAQGMASPQEIQAVQQNLAQRFPQPGAQPPVDVGAQFAGNIEGGLVKSGLDPAVAKEIAKHMNDAGPPKLIGKDIFGDNRGGIFGTGISPIDVLAYAIGGAITSRLPQDQALAMTMKIGSFPSQYRDAQQKAGAQVINQIIGASNAGANQLSEQDRHAKMVNDQVQIKAASDWITNMQQRLATGKPLSTLEKQQALLGAHKAGIPDSIANKLFSNNDLPSVLAELELAQNYLNSSGISGAKLESKTGSGLAITLGGGEKAPNNVALLYTAATGKHPDGSPATAQEVADAKQYYNLTINQAGAKAGAISAATPLPPQQQEKQASILDFKRTIDRLITNFKDAYTGPVRGRTYDLARQGLPGFSKATESESQWRSDLANATSVLVNIRSGQQSAEPEFRRLSGIIGLPTDDPKVIKASLMNMRTQLEQIIKDRQALATQPKGAGGIPSGARRVEE